MPIEIKNIVDEIHNEKTNFKNRIEKLSRFLNSYYALENDDFPKHIFELLTKKENVMLNYIKTLEWVLLELEKEKTWKE
jgi:hypothetical protein